ncbi:MAG: hypothetical protein AB1689_23510, partial [Thermodesulfobacteriota bacterium]
MRVERLAHGHGRRAELPVARCRSRWLLRLTALLADHSQRYAMLATLAGAQAGHHDTVAEHG